MANKGTFKKGDKRAGRKPGVPNKATRNAREAIALLVESNVSRMQGWLDDIAQTEGSHAAWKCMQDVIEYHMPKLSRAELTGPEGGPMQVNINDPTRGKHRAAK